MMQVKTESWRLCCFMKLAGMKVGQWDSHHRNSRSKITMDIPHHCGSLSNLRIKRWQQKSSRSYARSPRVHNQKKTYSVLQMWREFSIHSGRSLEMKRKATEPYTMIALGESSMQNPSLLQLALQIQISEFLLKTSKCANRTRSG